MGLVFWSLHVYWLNVVPGLPVAAFLAIVFYCSLFFGIFGFFYTMIIRRTRWPRVLVAPVLWVAIEFMRYNLSFFSVPWGLIGHSQHDNIEIIQIASFTSVYGVSFLILLVNAAIAEGFLWLLNRRKGIIIPLPPAKIVLSYILGTFVIVFIIHLWGEHQVKTLGTNTKSLLTASLIQGNIPQDEKWDYRFCKMIIERYSELTLKASRENPDIIIWPEASTPGYLSNDPFVYMSVRDIIRETGIPLLFGSASYGKTGQGGHKIYKHVNTAFLMGNNGRVLSDYNKIILVPFWEFLPLEGKFPWPQWLVPKHGSELSGRDINVFEVPKGKFGVTICWENLFPHLVRKFVNRGSQFMVNLTNEAMFGKTVASQQIMSMAVFRAVENRVALLRCTNTGITSLVDPLGRVVQKVTDEKGNDIMVTGLLTVSVPEPAGPTFYTKHGDLFASTCATAALLFSFSAILPLRTRKFFRLSKES
jgi:apolipoprotein N-acyltransferase